MDVCDDDICGLGDGFLWRGGGDVGSECGESNYVDSLDLNIRVVPAGYFRMISAGPWSVPTFTGSRSTVVSYRHPLNVSSVVLSSCDAACSEKSPVSPRETHLWKLPAYAACTCVQI